MAAQQVLSWLGRSLLDHPTRMPCEFFWSHNYLCSQEFREQEIW
jgi:hypothetical protein